MKKSFKRQYALIVISPIFTALIMALCHFGWWSLLPIGILLAVYLVGVFLANVLCYVEKREAED